MSEPFRFHDPGRLKDGDLSLVLEEQSLGDPARGICPSYTLRMIHAPRGYAMGRISLRIGEQPATILYAGHVGYTVHPTSRGHHYAARSCRLLMPLARAHGMGELWITCNPDNFASRRTCELTGARFVEIVDLPPETDMYQRGERQKCRYRLAL